MKIGIDCRTILNPGFGENAGVGHFTYALVETLLRLDTVNRYTLFFDQNVLIAAAQEFIGSRPLVALRFLPAHRYKKYLPVLWSQVFLPYAFAKEKLDLLLSPSGHIPETYRGAVLAVAHDLSVFKHPEWFPSVSRAALAANRALFERSMRRARRIIAVSEATKRDLVELLKIPAAKIDVVYEGVTAQTHISLGSSHKNCTFNDDVIRTRFHLSERFVLFIGTIEPRKNILTLVRAFSRFLESHPELGADLSLAIAGAKGWKHETVFAEIDHLNAELLAKIGRAPIRYLGYVTTEEKWALFRSAEVFCFPSFDEGFGLPALEAMSVGTPVIVSNRGALPEVVGHAGIFINPEFTDDLYHAFCKLLLDPVQRQKFALAAQVQAKTFSWEKAAQLTLRSAHRALMGAED